MTHVRFSKQVLQIFIRAETHAKREHQAHVGGDHLLKAILQEPAPEVDRLLRKWQLDSEALYGASLKDGHHQEDQELILSDEVKAMVSHAREEARIAGRHWVDPEHLLLGVLSNTTSSAAKRLARFDIDLQTARKHLYRSFRYLAAGILLLVNFLVQVYELLGLAGPVASWKPDHWAVAIFATVDLCLVVGLLMGVPKVFRFAEWRAAMGLLYALSFWESPHVEFMVVEGLFSLCILGLLLGRPGKIRISICVIFASFILLLEALSIRYRIDFKTKPVEELIEELREQGIEVRSYEPL